MCLSQTLSAVFVGHILKFFLLFEELDVTGRSLLQLLSQAKSNMDHCMLSYKHPSVVYHWADASMTLTLEISYYSYAKVFMFIMFLFYFFSLESKILTLSHASSEHCQKKEVLEYKGCDF